MRTCWQSDKGKEHEKINTTSWPNERTCALKDEACFQKCCNHIHVVIEGDLVCQPFRRQKLCIHGPLVHEQLHKRCLAKFDTDRHRQPGQSLPDVGQADILVQDVQQRALFPLIDQSSKRDIQLLPILTSSHDQQINYSANGAYKGGPVPLPVPCLEGDVQHQPARHQPLLPLVVQDRVSVLWW